MSILIAGRPVKVGDALYHKGFESWGRVSRFDPSGSAEFILKSHGGQRKLLIQSGGVVNGRRQMYWHEPITLDLPRQNIQPLQRVVDAIASEILGKDEVTIRGEDL